MIKKYTKKVVLNWVTVSPAAEVTFFPSDRILRRALPSPAQTAPCSVRYQAQSLDYGIGCERQCYAVDVEGLLLASALLLSRERARVVELARHKSSPGFNVVNPMLISHALHTAD